MLLKELQTKFFAFLKTSIIQHSFSYELHITQLASYK